MCTTTTDRPTDDRPTLDGGAKMGDFAYLTTSAELVASGGVAFDYKITPFDAAQYETNPSDTTRFVLEIVFLLMLFRLILIEGDELFERFRTRRAAGHGIVYSLMGYFGDFGNMLDLTNYVIQALACATWVRFIWKCSEFQDNFDFHFPIYEVRLTR